MNRSLTQCTAIAIIPLKCKSVIVYEPDMLSLLIGVEGEITKAIDRIIGRSVHFQNNVLKLSDVTDLINIEIRQCRG